MTTTYRHTATSTTSYTFEEIVSEYIENNFCKKVEFEADECDCMLCSSLSSEAYVREAIKRGSAGDCYYECEEDLQKCRSIGNLVMKF